MKFTIEIELGNDAMRRYSHIKSALRELARGPELGNNGPRVGDGSNIRDVNGNTVGKWEIVEE